MKCSICGQDEHTTPICYPKEFLEEINTILDRPSSPSLSSKVQGCIFLGEFVLIGIFIGYLIWALK